MENTLFESGRHNNEKRYIQAFKSYAKVVEEHVCKLYVFAWAPTRTPKSWKTSLFNSGLALGEMHWGISSARIRWSAPVMEEHLLDAGFEEAEMTAAHFESCVRTFEGYGTPYEDNPKAIDLLAERAQPNILSFIHDLSLVLAKTEKFVDRVALNAAIESHFSDEKVKVLSPEEATRLHSSP